MNNVIDIRTRKPLEGVDLARRRGETKEPFLLVYLDPETGVFMNKSRKVDLALLGYCQQIINRLQAGMFDIRPPEGGNP